MGGFDAGGDGVGPRLRLGSRWVNLLWLLPIALVVLLGGVAAAKGLRGIPSVQRFITDYPGTDLRGPRRLPRDSGVGAVAALLQPVLPAVHHALRARVCASGNRSATSASSHHLAHTGSKPSASGMLTAVIR